MSRASSATAMKSSGDTRPRLGCCQRSSASTPATAAGGEVDLRLVEEPELVALERLAQVALERQALQRAGVHRRRAELEAVASQLLGAVHGDVGAGQQRLGVVAVGREEADADAGGDVEPLAVDLDRPGDGRRASSRAVRAASAPSSDVGQQQGELVAADPRHRVALRAPTAAAAAPISLQQAVAGGVPERVVDQLELIEIQEEHRQAYPKKYVEACRARVDANLRAYKKQVGKSPAKDFEARYFNDQVLLWITCSSTGWGRRRQGRQRAQRGPCALQLAPLERRQAARRQAARWPNSAVAGIKLPPVELRPEARARRRREADRGRLRAALDGVLQGDREEIRLTRFV